MSIFRFFFLLAVGLVFRPVTGCAAFDVPASWDPGESPTFTTSAAAQFDAPWNLYHSLLSRHTTQRVFFDSDHRVSREFSVPAELRPQVQFWLDIYTRYSSQEVVIFDEEHPEVVYETIDFRELARTSRTRAAYEIVSKNIIKTRVKSIVQNLKQALQPTKPASPLLEEARRLLALRSSIAHQHSAGEVLQSIRVQWGQRDRVMGGLLSSNAFIQRMEKIFERLGLPAELVLLSLVESSFNWNAVSRSGAVGVWQFMPDSGREFLRVSAEDGIDERLSPVKSTVAAARLLLRNYRILGAWPLAISAYNHGHTKWRRITSSSLDIVPKVLAQCSRSKTPVKLGFASRNYYAEFLALLRAYKYQEVVFGPVEAEPLTPVQFIRIEKAQSLSTLVADRGLVEAELRRLNPDLQLLAARLPRGYWISVPSDSDDFSGLVQPYQRVVIHNKAKLSDVRITETKKGIIPRS